MLGYTSWHQLFVYSYFTCLLPACLIMLLLFSCLFIMLFSYPMLQLSCYYFVYIVYMHEQSSLHKHSPGRFLTTLDLHVQILDALFPLFRCSLRPYASRRARASPYSIPIFLSFLPSYYFSDSHYIIFSCYSSLYSYDIMLECLYVILQ